MASRIPGWKAAIEKGINKHGNQTVIQIATLESHNGQIVPRVRSHIFRTFLDSPVNSGLPLLLSSTDVRTPKVQQLTQNSNSEIAWWMEPMQQQFRIAASVYIFPGPGHPLTTRFMEILANADPETSLAQFKDNDWEQTRQTLFRSMSGHMKASWCRPIPGSVLPGDGQEVDPWPVRIDEPDVSKENYLKAKRLWDIALGNFALVVIDPVEVDFVDLRAIPNTRSLFTKKKGSPGEWVEQGLVP